jgi:catechol 2,3-dioxygenase-like lactoylglutathione lyase family enzyme
VQQRTTEIVAAAFPDTTDYLRNQVAVSGDALIKYLDVEIKLSEESAPVIHHVQLACPPGSEDISRAFYGGVLGLDEIAKPPVLAKRGGCWFRGHGFELHLGVEADFRPARKAHPALLVSGIEEWAERLSAAGYAARFDDEFPGMHRFYTDDPHGNRLEFLEPLSAQ